MQITDEERKILNKKESQITLQDNDILIDLEKRIEKEENCSNCGGAVLGAFRSFMCQDCGTHFNFEDFIEE